MTPLALAFAYSGFTALSLAMERHHRQVLARPPTRATAHFLRCVGLALLALALLACLTDAPGSLGFVVWLGLLTAAAVPLVFVLPYAPRAVAAVAIGAPLAAAILAFA